MIDDSGCYVQSVALGPQCAVEKMDICCNNRADNGGDAVGGEEECRGDNEWEEEKILHNRDNSSIVETIDEVDAVANVNLPTTWPVVKPCKQFNKNKKKLPRCPQSRIADKYGQRSRTIIRRFMLEKRFRETSQQKGAKAKLHTFTKCRKKTVNARGWCHMQEINLAFESLRNALPTGYSNTGSDTSAAAKMTTLRLALRYITTLTQLLQDDPTNPQPPDDEEECHDTLCCSSDERNYYANSHQNSDHNYPIPCCVDVNNVISHHHVRNEEKNRHTKRCCRGHNDDHARDINSCSHDHTTHLTTLHHDQHKRQGYYADKDDSSHDSSLDGGDRNSSSSLSNDEEEEENPEDVYIEALAGIFQETENSSRDAEEESCTCKKDIQNIFLQEKADVPHARSVTLSKPPLTSTGVMRGHEDDLCTNGDFGDLSDYHAESHLEVLNDLKQLSDEESKVLLLATNVSALGKKC